MKINKFIYYILVISLVSNCLFIYAKFINKISINESSLLSTFSDKENSEISIESIQLNPLESLLTMNADTINLCDIIDQPEKIFLMISDISCSSCTAESLKSLNSILNNFDSKDIIILGLYENKRDFFLLSKQFPFNFFLITEVSALKKVAFKSPAFFSIDNNYRIKHAFLPMIKYPNITINYLTSLIQNLE